MASEPDATGSGQFQGTLSGRGGVFNRPRTSNINAQFSFNVPGLGDVQKQLTGVSDALKELKATLQGMSSAFTSGPIVNMLSAIREEAAATSASLRDLSGSVSGVSGAGGGRGGPPGGARMHNGNSTSANAGVAIAATQSAAAAVGAAGGGSGSYSSINDVGTQIGKAANTLSGGGLLGAFPGLGTIINSGASIAMMPLNFTRERIQNNRTAALGMSQELTPYQWAIGGSLGNPTSLMRSLSSGQFPGGMMGDVSDILNALTTGRRSGAQYGFGNQSVTGARAGGFYSAIGQMQQITPGIGAGQAASVLGAQVGNTASQQASAFYTGGAFSMVKQGGGQKNIREWSEGILRFLEGQRPGNKRGVKFTYGELLAQNFPGSNVNAWFSTVGVSPDMMDYFWSYALGQAQTGSTDVFATMGGEGGALTTNQAWRRLQSQNVLARNEFGLAGRMGGQYAMREQSNQWFNQAMGAMVNKLVPAFASSPLGQMIGLMPDQVEEFMWNALQASGPVTQVLASGLSGLSMAANLGTIGTGASPSTPGPGVGDYDSQGGRTTAGLSLDLRGKMQAMMRANPNLRINSGLRDTYTQQKLKAKGIGQFGSKNGRSPHYAGEAADIGPASQYGWIAANAHKFGLQSAGHKGEPWHVQRAGTMGVGDGVGDVPAWADWIPGVSTVSSVLGFTEDIAGLVRMMGKVYSGVLKAMDAAESAATLFNPSDMLSGGAAAVPSMVGKFMSLLTGGVDNKGGLQNLIKGASGNEVTGYDPSFAKGLPSSINLTNVTSGGGGGGGGLGSIWKTLMGGLPGWGTINSIVDPIGSAATAVVSAGGSWLINHAGGAFSGADFGGTAATLSDIFSRYSAGAPSQSRTPDAATTSRIRAALTVAQQAGFSGEELIAFVSLAGRETNFNPTSYNGSGKDQSYGLWQINTKDANWSELTSHVNGLTSKDQLLDPAMNAAAGKYLFDRYGLDPWGKMSGLATPLSNGAEQWVAPVYSIAKDMGFIGDPGSYGGSSGGGLNFTFHNQFQIDASKATAANGSLSVDRLVPLLADKLETEMKRRLVGAR